MMLQTTLPGLPGADYTWIAQFERTGLITALIWAVAVLWKSRAQDAKDRKEEIERKDAQLAAKDVQILTMVEHVTATMTQQVETNRELRKIIEQQVEINRESVRTKEQLRLSIDNLAVGISGLPCTDPIPRIPKKLPGL